MFDAVFLAPLFLFAFTASATPGPNVLMLAASGVNFGFRRTVPHMAGIVIGFPVMIVAVGLGLGELFTRFPLLHQVLKGLGAAYLLWLAWKIANASSVSGDKQAAKPFGFFQAAGFQWVNPKAWIMAISAIAAFATLEASFAGQVMMIALVFGLVGIPSVIIWAAFGTGIRRYLKSDRHLRLFNRTMALLLVASLIPAFWP
ncbi:LysE family translocator [Coralliovum pocilloporae]|uniref:LysE family translocator n=1 Tax=Coralliovum pocilloporae TaxID=3066369 RepID=UPI003306BEB4